MHAFYALTAYLIIAAVLWAAIGQLLKDDPENDSFLNFIMALAWPVTVVAACIDVVRMMKKPKE
jgi:hypothetical protein